MKYIALIISIVISSFQPLFSQEKNESIQKFRFFLGVQTRVTPIYPKGLSDVITVQDRNIWEQPDKHLSGPSLIWGIERSIDDSYNFSFTQAVRYDFIYQTQPYRNQPYAGFQQQSQRAIVSDIYLDVFRNFKLNNSEFQMGAGFAICGLGTGYLLTQRFLDNNNQSFFITSKEDFLFPAVTATFGWQKNKFNAALRMGYAWNNPTLFKTAFIFPEIKLHYNIFSF
jgi:hypothetical protein